MVAEYDARRKLICGLLDAIPNLKYVKPQGAFYVLVDISATGQNSTQFAERLLDKQKVAVVPGVAFGDDKTVRLSYATSRANIEEGLKRIASFVAGS
jgi:aspartate aminotransferase